MKKTYKFMVAFLLSISLLMATNEARCYALAMSSAVVDIEGADLNCTLSCDTTYARATASFVGGSGTVEATARGYYYDEDSHEVRISSFNSNPTPGGVSATANCRSGYSFFAAEGVYAVRSPRGTGGTNLYVSLE